MYHNLLGNTLHELLNYRIFMLTKFFKKNCGLALTRFSRILLYNRRKNYYKPSHSYFNFILYAWINNLILYLWSAIFQFNSFILLKTGCNHIIPINKLITKFLRWNWETNEIFRAIDLKLQIKRYLCVGERGGGYHSPQPFVLKLYLHEWNVLKKFVQDVQRTLIKTPYGKEQFYRFWILLYIVYELWHIRQCFVYIEFI